MSNSRYPIVSEVNSDDFAAILELLVFDRIRVVTRVETTTDDGQKLIKVYFRGKNRFFYRSFIPEVLDALFSAVKG